MEGLPSDWDMFVFLMVAVVLPVIGISIVNYLEGLAALNHLKKTNPELYKALTGKDPNEG